MSERKLPNTRVIRITEASYRRMKSLKAIYQDLKHNGRKITFSEMLDELNNVAELLLAGAEVYEVDGKLYDDHAEAWGHAIQLLVQQRPQKPTVYIRLGHDDAFDLPEQA
jgi:hypothetical protein